MHDSSGHRIPDSGLWWIAISLLVAMGVYFALAEASWGLAMGLALALTALLLNHKRLTDSTSEKATSISVFLTVVMGLAFALAHFVVGPAIRG